MELIPRARDPGISELSKPPNHNRLYSTPRPDSTNTDWERGYALRLKFICVHTRACACNLRYIGEDGGETQADPPGPGGPPLVENKGSRTLERNGLGEIGSI